jgi:hypothetical protein
MRSCGAPEAPGVCACACVVTHASVRHACRYITAVYWAYTTMTTVGYGDIYGTTIAEKVSRAVGNLCSCQGHARAASVLRPAQDATAGV